MNCLPCLGPGTAEPPEVSGNDEEASFLDGGGTVMPGHEERYPEADDGRLPRSRDEMRGYVGRGLLDGVRALVTGGDHGIGRAVAVAFAKEGADVAISYLSRRAEADARHTARLVERENRVCVTLRADVGREVSCEEVVSKAAEGLGGLDVLVNNGSIETPVEDLAELSTEQWERTFQVNVHSCFWLTRAALAHLTPGGRVINSGSVNGLLGSPRLIDYSASKGAVLALTYSLAQALQDRAIRVNCVASGPVTTSLALTAHPAGSGPADGFGEQAPSSATAHPDDIAPSYVFFASDALSGHHTGEVLTPAGGDALPGPVRPG